MVCNAGHAMTASLSSGRVHVTRVFTGAIIPVDTEAVFVRRRQLLGLPPLHQLPGTVSLQRLRLSSACAFNLITNEL
jgi:hypothetical protein